MKEQLPRLDTNPELRQRLLPYCRLQPGEIWEDPHSGHRVGALDATRQDHIERLLAGQFAAVAIQDPPYNFSVGSSDSPHLPKQHLPIYLAFCQGWLQQTLAVLEANAHLYVWLGADVRDNFQPLPDVMILMRQFAELQPRNLITLRNQRGYGTQHNWMWVRQELLHYTKGKPPFQVVYTDIPKIMRGYYKTVNGRRTENLERSKSKTIRPGNVWVDIQQVFYRMAENVPGCYAQKPLAAIERIISSSSQPGERVLDFFAHSGTTLLAGERLGRQVFTCDVDPVFAEITIRRLERYRDQGQTGWQWHSPFPEVN